MKRTKIGKGKVWANALMEIEKRFSKRKKGNVKGLYGHPKIVTFKMNPNTDTYRVLSKEILLTESLSATAKGIYPVLCMLSDFEKNREIQVSRENLGVYAGLSDWTTIEKAVNELIDAELVDGKKAEYARKIWVYDVKFIRKDQMDEFKAKDIILFHTSIIESGLWAKLRPKEQALYLTLRSLAETFFDYETDYKTREYETFYGKWKYLSEKSGVSLSQLRKSIRRLERVGLIVMEGNRGVCCDVYFQSLFYDEIYE